jgi:hypothetical protein
MWSEGDLRVGALPGLTSRLPFSPDLTPNIPRGFMKNPATSPPDPIRPAAGPTPAGPIPSPIAPVRFYQPARDPFVQNQPVPLGLPTNTAEVPSQTRQRYETAQATYHRLYLKYLTILPQAQMGRASHQEMLALWRELTNAGMRYEAGVIWGYLPHNPNT